MLYKKYLIIVVVALALSSILQLKWPSRRLDKIQTGPFEFGNV